jgi:hypothetical protein
VAELKEHITAYGIKKFIFITESIPPAFARRMSKLIISKNLEINWISFAMVDRRFDRELLGLMAKAGCDHLVIGLETMNTRLLKLVHKSADREENIRFLRDARDAGMKLRINLIPDLPSATYKEAIAALEDIKQLEDCFESVLAFPFEATRSSNVGQSPETFGLIPRESSGTGIAQYALNHLGSNDPAMTATQRAEIHRIYQAYEDEINRRKKNSGGIAIRSTEPAETCVRLRVRGEFLDIVRDGDRLICYDMRSIERLDLTAGCQDLLLAYSDGRAFDRPELSGNGITVSELELNELIGKGILVSGETI